MVEDLAIPIQLCRDDFRFLKLRSGGKEPTYDMKGWQNNNFQYNDTELLNHLINEGNYGIIGGYGNLILIDADSEEINKIAENMPDTFTVKTGSPENYKKHYFFITDKPMKAIRLSKEHVGDLGDVRSIGQYVVAPNSIHPSGNKYVVIKNLPITKITEEKVREFFKDYIDKHDPIETKNFEPELKLRNSNFIKFCNVPDYCMKNKLKGNTGKNWKLFPYIVDILHNRQTLIEPYEKILEMQGHQKGAIKGWLKLAREGKLAKSSCKKMREYLQRFHPEEEENICKDCPLFQKHKEIQEIKTDKDNSELQREVLTNLALKKKDIATELIVDYIEENYYIYTTKDDIKSEMWIYQDGIYIPNGRSIIREFCRKILNKAYNNHLGNIVISKVETDTYIVQEEFFDNKYITEIAVQNGILDVITKKLSPYDPKKIFFNKLPVIYSPDANNPHIEQFLEDILDKEEDLVVMYEVIGSGLYKEYFTEKAVMLVGSGRNGKSKLLELIKRLVGIENCCCVPIRSMKEDNSSLCELYSRLFNLAGDLSGGDLKDTGVFKQTVGRDTLQTHRKFLRDLIFVNFAKHIFACNELPRVFDTTDGFWDKWVLLNFPYKFVTKEEFNLLSEEEKEKHKIKDPDIINKISTEEELSGLLNKALDGLHRLLKQKNYSQSKGTKDIKDFWIRNSDSFSAFCIDNIKEDNSTFISKRELRKQFNIYCKKFNLKGAGDKGIKATLEDRYGVIESRKTINDDQQFVWEGINFKWRL